MWFDYSHRAWLLDFDCRRRARPHGLTARPEHCTRPEHHTYRIRTVGDLHVSRGLQETALAVKLWCCLFNSGVSASVVVPLWVSSGVSTSVAVLALQQQP